MVRALRAKFALLAFISPRCIVHCASNERLSSSTRSLSFHESRLNIQRGPFFIVKYFIHLLKGLKTYNLVTLEYRVVCLAHNDTL